MSMIWGCPNLELPVKPVVELPTPCDAETVGIVYVPQNVAKAYSSQDDYCYYLYAHKYIGGKTFNELYGYDEIAVHYQTGSSINSLAMLYFEGWNFSDYSKYTNYNDGNGEN